MGISNKFCPRCGSDQVVMVAGGTTGTFMCKKCGYSGSVFPERELLGREAVTRQDHIHTNELEEEKE